MSANQKYRNLASKSDNIVGSPLSTICLGKVPAPIMITPFCFAIKAAESGMLRYEVAAKTALVSTRIHPT
jgi:hypothetical protein